MSPLSLLPLPLHSFQPEPTSQLELMRDPAELRVFLQERAGELQALALGALQDAAREALPVAAAVAAEVVAAEASAAEASVAEVAAAEKAKKKARKGAKAAGAAAAESTAAGTAAAAAAAAAVVRWLVHI